ITRQHSDYPGMTGALEKVRAGFLGLRCAPGAGDVTGRPCQVVIGPCADGTTPAVTHHRAFPPSSDCPAVLTRPVSGQDIPADVGPCCGRRLACASPSPSVPFR